ncbi:MAG: histidine phosphatase family protein, partial [Verrucomicrobiae bacterium]|nr:histidine phosphatase family protein [Verrucomicrobiae bacterium]
MKELILIRHAKSDWGDASLDDHERSLNDRGLRDAPRVGEELARRGAKPDVILTSTAVRALTTARAVAGKLDFPAGRIAAMGELYL